MRFYLHGEVVEMTEEAWQRVVERAAEDGRSLAELLEQLVEMGRLARERGWEWE